ncbi:hypothetical protein PLESTB_001671400 [Pleodorina starrii]|uniref:Uncharacterized protein n=1 Tax=Pleodorina starrii TaxID=330485 RepID=A0A9W6BYA7_9CHLO|nr:hypothetical protein PLESTB_001671400 [Pleodorina starrii]
MPPPQRTASVNANASAFRREAGGAGCCCGGGVDVGNGSGWWRWWRWVGSRRRRVRLPAFHFVKCRTSVCLRVTSRHVHIPTHTSHRANVTNHTSHLSYIMPSTSHSMSSSYSMEFDWLSFLAYQGI